MFIIIIFTFVESSAFYLKLFVDKQISKLPNFAESLPCLEKVFTLHISYNILFISKHTSIFSRIIHNRQKKQAIIFPK